jgi:hypothetical protein
MAKNDDARRWEIVVKSQEGDMAEEHFCVEASRRCMSASGAVRQAAKLLLLAASRPVGGFRNNRAYLRWGPSIKLRW